MKIAFLITRADAIGGAAIHVRDLAVRLKADGHEPIVATGGEGMYAEMLRRCGVQHYPLRWLRRSLHPVADLRSFAEVRTFLRECKPALLSTHSSKAGVIGRLAARSCGVPVIFTAHGWAFTDGVPVVHRNVYKAIDRITIPLTSRVITVSDFDRQLALRNRVGRADRMATIHNGMPEIGPAALANPAASPPRLIMVARFERQKDHTTLFHALASLRHLEWSLRLVGDGPYLQPMKELAHQLGLSPFVEFVGYTDNVAGLLASSQIFVLSSHWEGLPRTIVEAMRAGLPVVASDVGGVAELVADGQSGYLVPATSVDLLADRLRKLIEQPQARAEFGAAGRRRYEEEFTFAQMYQRTVALYDQILATS